MSNEAQRRMDRGKILLFQRRYAQAEAELSQALVGEVDRALVLYWLAWAQQAQGRLEEGDATARRSIAENPQRSEGYHALAVVMRKKGLLAEAEEAIRKAMEKDFVTVEYRSELAWILLNRRRPGDALKLVDEGLPNAPQAVELHRARTQALIQLNQLYTANDSARHTLSLDPEDATSHGQLGNIAFQQKDYAAAQAHYTEALRLDPGYTYARTGLLSTLRHRIWYYRVLVPKNSASVGRRRNVWFYAVIAVGAAIRAVPVAGGVLGGVFLLLLVLALVRWYLGVTVAPVTTLLLRLNPVGRAALSADEIECSDFVGLMLAGAALAFVGAILGGWHGLFAVGLLLMAMLVPVTKMFQVKGRQRTVGEAYTWLLFSIGCGGVAALASEMYGLAAVAFLACGTGALTYEVMTDALGRFLAGLARLTGRKPAG